jgi:hypothetical protein
MGILGAVVFAPFLAGAGGSPRRPGTVTLGGGFWSLGGGKGGVAACPFPTDPSGAARLTLGGRGGRRCLKPDHTGRAGR